MQQLCDTAAASSAVVGASAPVAVGVAAQLAYLQGLEATVAKHLSAADEQLSRATAELSSVKGTYAKLQHAEEAMRIIARDAEASKQQVRSTLQSLHAQAQTLDQDINVVKGQMKQQGLTDNQIAALQVTLDGKLAQKRGLATDFGIQQGQLAAIDQQTNAKAAPYLQEIADAHQKGVYGAKQLQAAEKRQEKLAESLPMVKTAGAAVRACLQGKIKQLASAPASQRGDASGNGAKDTRDFGAINQEGDKFRQGGQQEGGTAEPARGTGLGGGNAVGQRNAQDSARHPTGGALPSPYGYSPYGYPAAGSRQDAVEVPHDQLPPFTNPGTSDQPAGMSGKPGRNPAASAEGDGDTMHCELTRQRRAVAWCEGGCQKVMEMKWDVVVLRVVILLMAIMGVTVLGLPQAGLAQGKLRIAAAAFENKVRMPWWVRAGVLVKGWPRC